MTEKMHLLRWPFRWPCGSGGMVLEGYWYGASLGGPKTRKCIFFELFDVRFYKYLRRLLVKTRHSKRMFKEQHANLTTPTKYFS
jgi:hypothetical protein